MSPTLITSTLGLNRCDELRFCIQHAPSDALQKGEVTADQETSLERYRLT